MPESGTSFGNVLAVLDAVNTHETAVRIIDKAALGERVTMLGFSFDRKEIVQALVGARRRGCIVRVVLDHNMTLQGKTKEQYSSAEELASCGVLVRVASGIPLKPEYDMVGRSAPAYLKGIQHAKAVIAGREAVIGSANWTTCSRSNQEMGVHIELNASHAGVIEEMFLSRWHDGMDVEDASKAAVHRARSNSPTGRGLRRGWW